MAGDNEDWLRDILGLDVDDERAAAVIAAYRDILAELRKLRALDLTDIHPAVVFSPVSSIDRQAVALIPSLHSGPSGGKG